MNRRLRLARRLKGLEQARVQKTSTGTGAILVWSPARIPTPGEWNVHMIMKEENRQAWQERHPGEDPPAGMDFAPEFAADPALCACRSYPLTPERLRELVAEGLAMDGVLTETTPSC